MKKILLSLALVMGSLLGANAQDIFAAARANDTVALKTYLDQGVKVDTTNNRGFTPLILAVYNGSAEATTFLIKNGANINGQDMSGNTALMGAIFKANAPMASLLIQHKADINKTNFNDATALTFAATFGQLAIAKALLAAGADKSIKDNTGKTPLDHAIFQENEAMIQLLK